MLGCFPFPLNYDLCLVEEGRRGEEKTVRKRNTDTEVGGGWAGHQKASVGKTPFGYRGRTVSLDLFI